MHFYSDLLSCSALINGESFLRVHQLGKHICWKISGFMVVRYYVAKKPTFHCGLLLFQTGKSGYLRG